MKFAHADRLIFSHPSVSELISHGMFSYLAHFCISHGKKATTTTTATAMDLNYPSGMIEREANFFFFPSSRTAFHLFIRG